MAFGLRILVSILVVFLLLQTLNATSTSSGRRPLARNKNHQIPPNYTHLVFKSQCSQNPQCQWCKSQSLDDTCFTRFEAWRLPLLLLGLFVCSFSFWGLNFLTFLGFYFYFSFFLFFHLVKIYTKIKSRFSEYGFEFNFLGFKFAGFVFC